MKTVTVEKVAAQFNQYVAASRKQPVLITENGKPVAVLFAVENKAEAEVAVRRMRSLQSILKEGNEQIEKGEGIPHDEFWKKIALMRSAKPRGRNRRNAMSSSN